MCGRVMLVAGDMTGACSLLTESDGGIAQEGMDLMLSLRDPGMNMQLALIARGL